MSSLTNMLILKHSIKNLPDKSLVKKLLTSHVPHLLTNVAMVGSMVDAISSDATQHPQPILRYNKLLQTQDPPQDLPLDPPQDLPLDLPLDHQKPKHQAQDAQNF